jgi:hypothetical protein
MTAKEAAIRYNIDLSEDIADQFEFHLFELKQKIYRQLDQILLYPKWLRELSNLHAAALAFELVYPNDALTTLLQALNSDDPLDPHLSMQVQLKAYFQFKSQIAYLVYNAKSPELLISILYLAQTKLLDFHNYWVNANLSSQEVRLTAQFDPQLLHSALEDFDKCKTSSIEQLNEENTPQILKEFIAWNRAILTKLKNH